MTTDNYNTPTTSTSSTTSTTGSTVTQVTPQERDIIYNPASDQAALPVDVHFADGHAEESLLLLEPGQAEVCQAQLSKVLSHRYHIRKAIKDEER